MQLVACGLLEVAARVGGLARRRDGTEAIGGARREQRPQTDRQLRELLDDLNLVHHRAQRVDGIGDARVDRRQRGRIVQHQAKDDLQRRPVRQAHFRLKAALVGQEPGHLVGRRQQAANRAGM